MPRVTECRNLCGAFADISGVGGIVTPLLSVENMKNKCRLRARNVSFLLYIPVGTNPNV